VKGCDVTRLLLFLDVVWSIDRFMHYITSYGHLTSRPETEKFR